MAAAGEQVVHTYGNWRKPKSPGLAGLGLIGTALMLLSLIGLILTMFLGGLLEAVLFALGASVVLMMLALRDKHGRSGMQRISNRVGFAIARRRGSNVYRSGPVGATPWGTFQLPGLAAPSRLSEWEDSYRRPFALVHVPSTNHYTVVLACEPDGASLVDQETIDRLVAHWGMWLASLGHEPGIAAVSVTVETAPDTGARLAREIDLNIDESASAVAQAMLREVQETYPKGSAHCRAWIAVTFSGAVNGQRRKPEDMGRELASRLPGLTAGLSAAGAGAARPVSAQGLCEVIRTAYDPAAALLIDQAHAMGQTPDLRWSDVGPTAHEANWGSYRHDGAFSVTWSMTQAPRGDIYDSAFQRLLSPHPDIARKRVTLLYRPLDAATAAPIVESDKRNAEFHMSARPSARAAVDARAAAATARDEARGAGLVNFGAVVTATVLDAEKLPLARAAVDNLAPTARILVRPVYGSQDAAFAAGLPLGIVLPAHLRVPAELRENL
ncbi:hypothetical protein ET495_17260 (plasmid) [Xylanimonas allomyrinae]|uniref:PrgI family protein n=1 Tax=Xylanimonas allomyrinae TaxID=2509459 RepID=A0A4P6EQ75_9MICO|nr:SCO6880 family protein [Xylanimonas allomyrinae]QAY64972.1 hypothetical protein ET495_17260 [Xylanimonas allomyrinae]